MDIAENNLKYCSYSTASVWGAVTMSQNTPKQETRHIARAQSLQKLNMSSHKDKHKSFAARRKKNEDGEYKGQKQIYFIYWQLTGTSASLHYTTKYKTINQLLLYRLWGEKCRTVSDNWDLVSPKSWTQWTLFKHSVQRETAGGNLMMFDAHQTKFYIYTSVSL